jgi:hypothetical protein
MTRRTQGVAALAAAMLLVAGSTGRAQTLQERVDALEKKVEANEKTIAEKVGISIHALVAVDYLYDLNSPSNSPSNGLSQPFLRTFANEKNSFILNQGDIHVERNADNLPGFVVDLAFGKTGDVVNNATYFGRHLNDSTSINNGIPITGNGTDFFDAPQFYLDYTIPVGSGIKMKAGRFVTLMGTEVIKTYNNFNYNVTDSILFGFAIPFTHTGLLGSYAFTDQVSMDLGVVNGWDSLVDNNDGKSVIGGLNLAFDPHVTFYQAWSYGPEQTGQYVTNTVDGSCGTPGSPACDSTAQLYVHPSLSKRLMLTSMLTIKPIDPLTFILEFDYGNDSHSVPVNGLLRTAQWEGGAAYAIYNFTDSLSGCLRAEIFDDMNGARVLGPANGFATGGVGQSSTYWELTPTLTYKIIDGLYWRNEYRHDESDTKKVFAHQTNPVRGQDTLATELVYAF